MTWLLDHAITVRDIVYASGTVLAVVLIVYAVVLWRLYRGLP